MISQASVHICLNGSVLGDFVPSCNEESVNFGSISRIGSARKSPSLLGVLECSQPPLANNVRLATCGRLGRAISSDRSFRLRSRPLLDWSPSVGTSCCTCALFWFEDFLGWSSTSTHLESFYTRLRLTCRWRPDSSWVRVHAILGVGWLCYPLLGSFVPCWTSWHRSGYYPRNLRHPPYRLISDLIWLLERVELWHKRLCWKE